jgi:AP-3 complex subunit mu
VIEFLHRAVDIFRDYFQECNESSIKEHIVVVYEVSTENQGGVREKVHYW